MGIATDTPQYIVLYEGVSDETSIIIDDPQTDTVTESTVEVSVVSENTIDVALLEVYDIAVIDSGPGIPILREDDEEVMAYAKRVDFVGDNLIYRGEALPGVASASPYWRIRKITIAIDGDVSEEWADGNSNFDNVWDDRAILSYE